MTTFARTGAGDFPLLLKAMITGPPKSGKTTFLGTVPGLVIADTEPHANNLMSVAHLNIPYKTINSSTDLKDLHMVLANDSLRKQAAQALGMDDIQAVAIDTLDTLQGILKRERMAEQRTTSFQRDDWGWLKTEMENIIQSFLSLPLHVFLIVHTKTKDIGTEKNPRSVILPGLEGAISESIAGMVGYSLLSFRKQEINTATGVPFTKYWLRAEGDDVYEFLGNRAAGRLPDVIEPHFTHLLDAAKAGLAQAQAHQSQVVEVQTQLPPDGGIQTTAQIAPQQEVAPSPGQAPAAPVKPSDDVPITAAALQHMGTLYATIGAPFDQELFKAKTVGEARELAKAWQAIQQDHAEGKGQDESPQAQMIDYLGTLGLVGAVQEAAPVKVVEPKIDGTMEEVLAFVAIQGGTLDAIQEAYNFETGASGKNRVGLVNKLVSMGAKVPTAVQSPEAPAEPVAEAVTPAAVVADEPSSDEATQVIEQVMGPVEVLSDSINPTALCEVCNNEIDDADLAELGKQRFGKILCVNDYLVETKK